MFNLVNHSDTIACVLFELLVIWNWFTWVSKPTIRFHKFQFCSIFKVLLADHFRVTAYLLYLSKFILSRTFLRFFWSFFEAQELRKAFKGCCYAVFSGCRGRSRAGQLSYNTTGATICQHLFSIFLTNFLGHIWAPCILWALHFAATRVILLQAALVFSII